MIGTARQETLHFIDPSGVIPALAQLRNNFPDTPFVVLSSLAEKGDRLLIRLAMEHLATRLIVPLPFPLENYTKRFTTEPSRQGFLEFLQQTES